MIRRDKLGEELVEPWDEVRRKFNNLVKHPVQRGLYHRQIGSRYVDGRLHVHIHGVIAEKREQGCRYGFCLHCHAGIDEIAPDEQVLPLKVGDLNLSSNKDPNGQNWEAMLVSVNQVIEPAELLIPSSISLKVADDVESACRDATPRKSVQMVNVPLSSLGIGKKNREAECGPIYLSGQINGRIEVLSGQLPDNIVEGGPRIGDAISDKQAKSWRRSLGQVGFDPPMCRVYLGDETVRLCIEEGSALCFERVQVLLSPDDFEPSAV